MTEEIKRIEIVDLKPGDTIIIMVDIRLSDQVASRLNDHFRKEFPDNKCIVLEQGMTIGVARCHE